jgi:hypothetical protein
MASCFFPIVVVYCGRQPHSGTLGNIVGGLFFVAVIYWFVYESKILSGSRLGMIRAAKDAGYPRASKTPQTHPIDFPTDRIPSNRLSR